MNKLTQLEQKEIAEVLTTYGLSDREQQVYLFVLSHGQTTLTDIARGCTIAISTAQSVLERIVEQELIDIVKVKTKNTYLAANPGMLKKRLEKQMKEVSTILPYLKSIQDSTDNNVKVKVFYKERMADVFLASLESKEKLVYEIVSAKEIQQIFGEKFHYTKRRLEKKVHLKSLRVESNEIKKYNKSIHVRELREAKFLPRGTTFRSSIFFWDNTVAIFSPKLEGVAVMIESPSITLMMREMFEILWEVSRRMETV